MDILTDYALRVIQSAKIRRRRRARIYGNAAGRLTFLFCMFVSFSFAYYFVSLFVFVFLFFFFCHTVKQARFSLESQVTILLPWPSSSIRERFFFSSGYVGDLFQTTFAT